MVWMFVGKGWADRHRSGDSVMALMLARRAMRTMVYEVAPADGRIYLAVQSLLCTGALLARYPPA